MIAIVQQDTLKMLWTKGAYPVMLFIVNSVFLAVKTALYAQIEGQTPLYVAVE
jgi:hypothetical protein